MTILQIEILLHYYSRTNDFRDGDFSPPAVRQAIDEFVVNNLIEQSVPNVGDPSYVISERGRVYVETLCLIPLPIQKWVMPITITETGA